MTVITISRQFGSGGDEIATQVCEALGYPHFDKTLIDRAAAEAGISEAEVYDYSEDSHKVRTFMDRLFNRAVVMNVGRTWDDPAGIYYPETLPLSEDVMLTLVQKAIRGSYKTGDIVIVGRGSQVVLRGVLGVLHTRIVAPLEDRVQRVKEQLRKKEQKFQADLEIRRKAQDIIVERDAASADYIKTHYNVNWDDAQLYHVVLNTGLIPLEKCTQMIVDLAGAL